MCNNGAKKIVELLSTFSAKYEFQPIRIYFHVNKYQVSNLVFIENLQKIADQSMMIKAMQVYSVGNNYSLMLSQQMLF